MLDPSNFRTDTIKLNNLNRTNAVIILLGNLSTQYLLILSQFIQKASLVLDFTVLPFWVHICGVLWKYTYIHTVIFISLFILWLISLLYFRLVIIASIRNPVTLLRRVRMIAVIQDINVILLWPVFNGFLSMVNNFVS